MDNLIKVENRVIVQPDIAQTTILIDSSGSMDKIFNTAIDTLKVIINEMDGCLISVRSFNSCSKLLRDFTDEILNENDNPNGMTNIYGALNDAIVHSISSASLTLDIKVHHVFIIITDGLSNAHSELDKENYMAFQEALKFESTFIILDSSINQEASKLLGWNSTPFKNTPKSIKNALEKIRNTVSKINENIAGKLNPTANLLLPTAKMEDK